MEMNILKLFEMLRTEQFVAKYFIEVKFICDEDLYCEYDHETSIIIEIQEDIIDSSQTL